MLGGKLFKIGDVAAAHGPGDTRTVCSSDSDALCGCLAPRRCIQSRSRGRTCCTNVGGVNQCNEGNHAVHQRR